MDKISEIKSRYAAEILAPAKFAHNKILKGSSLEEITQGGTWLEEGNVVFEWANVAAKLDSQGILLVEVLSDIRMFYKKNETDNGYSYAGGLKVKITVNTCPRSYIQSA